MNGLRSYQVDGVLSVERAWDSGLQRPAGVAGTGAGKTQIFSHIGKRFYDRTGRQVLIFAHRTELVEQAASRVRRVAPGVGVGIVQAQRNQNRLPFVVGSVQTLAARNALRARMLPDVGLVVIDECHRAAAPSYVSVLDALGCFDPTSGVKALGVTATMSRSDTKALGDVWQDVAFTIPTIDLIEQGWLVRPRGLRVDVQDLDLSKVKRMPGTTGDYRDGALGAAMEASMAPEKIAEACRAHSPDAAGIVFTPTVHFAEIVAEAMREAGLGAAVVHGKTPRKLRADIIADYQAGRVQWLVNCGIFTEGTDLPRCKTVVIARPTKARGLYAQMVGRALRLYCPADAGRPDGQKHCEQPIVPAPPCAECCVEGLVIDVVGASEEHSLQLHIDLFGEDSAEPLDDEFELDGEELDAEDVTGDVLDVLPVDLDVPAAYRTGQLTHRPVDLFAASPNQWDRTARGVWFLALQDRYIAILPGRQPGYFAVWRVPMNGGLITELVPGIPTLGGCMKVAEGYVLGSDRQYARHAPANWRTRAREHASYVIDGAALTLPHIAATMR